MKTTILGLGIIGEAWAANLRADGIPLTVWNRTPKAVPGFISDAAEAVRDADFIMVVVSDPPAVDQVLDRIAPSLSPGSLLIQCSTVSAVWNRRFAQRVENAGARFLEAPFTGSKPAAEARKTVFYLGGDEAKVQAARPLLSRLGQTLLHIGPLGSASSLKLCMNANIALQMQALCESLRLARAENIPDEIFFAALKVNASRSGISDLKEPKLRAGDYAPQFSLKHMDKDLRLALETAATLPLPQLRGLKQQYDEGMRRGLADSDFSVLMQLL